jgi:ankyrin repeat protein
MATPQQMLHSAVSDGDSGRCLHAIALGANVNALTAEGADVTQCSSEHDNGETALYKAVAGGHDEIVAMLIAAGADVDHIVHDGETPLSKAVWDGKVNITSMLLAAGASTAYQVRDEDGGGGLLNVAASRGESEIEIVRLLIEAGAYLDERDVTGHTALHNAARRGNATGCELLIQAGADMHTFVVDGNTDEGESSPLRSAAAMGHVPVCRVLVAAGLSPSLAPARCADTYLTPMQIAAANGRPAVVQYFHEECGEDLEQVARDGRSLAQIAEASSMSVSRYLRSVLSQKEIGSALVVDVEDRPPASVRKSGMCPL